MQGSGQEKREWIGLGGLEGEEPNSGGKGNFLDISALQSPSCVRPILLHSF